MRNELRNFLMVQRQAWLSTFSDKEGELEWIVLDATVQREWFRENTFASKFTSLSWNHSQEAILLELSEFSTDWINKISESRRSCLNHCRCCLEQEGWIVKNRKSECVDPSIVIKRIHMRSNECQLNLRWFHVLNVLRFPEEASKNVASCSK